MKRTHYLWCCLSLLLMAGACSVDDADAFSDAYMDSADSAPVLLYNGSWSFQSWRSAYSVSDEINGTSPSGAAFHPGKQLFTAEMPVSLFLSIANITGETDAELPPYTVQCSDKGYNKSTAIYGITPSDYVFTVVSEGQKHEVRIIFNDYAEIGIDYYLSTLTFMIEIKGIYIDGTKADASGGMLIYKAEKE